MEFITVIEYITQIATIGMMASGIPPVWEMIKTKNTNKIPFVFFLLSVINCSSMLYYGMIQQNRVLILLNTLGSIMNIIYVLAYTVVSKSKLKPLASLACSVAYLFMLFQYLKSITNTPMEFADKLGFVGCVTCTVTFITPIIDVIDCLQRKSTENVAVEILVGGLICCSLWFIYGNLLHDPYIYVPNIPGLITGGLKVLMLMIFPRSQKQKSI